MYASDERDTKKIAKKIAKSINNRNITICLNGDLGAGKTTLTTKFEAKSSLRKRAAS